MPRPSKIHLHRGNWRTRINGTEYNLGKDKRKANIKFRQLIKRQPKQPSKGEPETLPGLIDRWLNLHPSADHECRLKDFARFGRSVPLPDVSIDTLAEYHQHLKRRTFTVRRSHMPPRRYSVATIRDRVRVAASVLRWGAEHGWCSASKVPRLARPVRRAKDIPIRQLQADLAAMPINAERVFRFLASTGARPGEATRLRWPDVDLDAGVINLHAHKTGRATGKQRTLYLTPAALTVLKETPHRTGYVFRSRLGTPYTTSGLRAISRRRGWTPYQLRHTFAQLASESLPESVLATLMGHADPRTTKHYYEVREGRARNAARGLATALDFPIPDEPDETPGDGEAEPKRA